MILKGQDVTAPMYQQLTERVGELKKKNVVPHLAVLLVGDNPNSLAYIRQKQKSAERINAIVTVHNFPKDVSTEELLQTVDKFNHDKTVHGIIVQKPLPEHIDVATLDQAVTPEKDIDGFNHESTYVLGLPLSVAEILKYVFHLDFPQGKQPEFIAWLKTKKLVVIGKGPTGGGPTIAYLQQLGVTPILVDRSTTNRREVLHSADIIVSATGKKDTITADDIKPGVILISVGLYKGEDGKLHSDYDEESIKDIANYYTPTPGGVGPVNVACLMENLVTAAERQTS